MTSDWTPDDDTARVLERYKRAHKTERELKPQVDAIAVEEMKRGATITQLAERTGLLPEVFRRLARKHDIPVSEKYRERAERLRRQSAE